MKVKLAEKLIYPVYVFWSKFLKLLFFTRLLNPEITDSCIVRNILIIDMNSEKHLSASKHSSR